MKPDLLISELNKLQDEYRTVLESALKNIYKKDSNAVVDEISVFWFRNKRLVKTILNYLHEPYTAYVFTAATIFDIEDYEHFPFVSVGKYHFWDDPIYKYSAISKKIDSTPFGEKMRQQVISTIEDNINILDTAGDIIYILPIRLLSELNHDLINKAAEKVFFSLFNKNLDFNYYKKNIKTISDIRENLAPGVEESIFFSENDNISLDFETRFRNYRESTVLPLPPNSTEAEVFLVGIYGYLVQALDIIFLCAEYRLIPYIRFNVAFKYTLLLSGNFINNQEISDMLFKCAIVHILHNTFNKKRIQNVDFKKYYQEIQENDFERQLFTDLKKEGFSISDISIKKVVSIINTNLDDVFNAL
jgi:hypothetical protein